MDLELLRAQWSATLLTGFLLPVERPDARPRCCQHRCKRPVAIKKNSEFAKSCQPCLNRWAASYKQRRAHFVALGGCREDRDREREERRQDAIALRPALRLG